MSNHVSKILKMIERELTRVHFLTLSREEDRKIMIEFALLKIHEKFSGDQIEIVSTSDELARGIINVNIQHKLKYKLKYIQCECTLD